MKRTKRNSFAFGLFLIIMSIFMSMQITANAEGTKQLIANGGYRPYTEWQSGTTIGIKRQQVMSVYAYADEKIYLGTSVFGDEKIVVRDPSGAETKLSVAENSAGYIANLTQESAGPNIDGSNSSGFTPLVYNVEKTGVYEVEFHSKNVGEGNPTKKKVDEMWIQNDSYIATWDITVTNASNEVVNGRVWTECLSLNVGANLNSSQIAGVTSQVYILTTDGYVYLTDFNGMDPYGFTFFANNRGLISTKTNSSLYHSVKDNTTIDASPLLANISSIKDKNGEIDGAFVPNPSLTVSNLDKSYKIFFNEPSNDLPESIKPTAQKPGTISDFKFKGCSDNLGYVGEGGYFYFTPHGVTSYQIQMDFTSYTYNDPDNPEQEINGGTLILGNSCIDGVENRIFWDGRDANGIVVPVGTYGGNDSNGVEIIIRPKSGEYHMPLSDVENSPFGIKVKLISTPEGIQADTISEEDRTRVYYNNQNTNRYRDNGYWNVADGLNHSIDGVATQATGVAPFTSKAGDKVILDFWTYFSTDESKVLLEDDGLTLIERTDNKGTISGFVFFDSNKDGKYNLSDNDYSLSGVTVTITDKNNSSNRWTVETDVRGFYITDNIPQGTYTITVNNPITGSSCTTSNQEQEIVLVGNSKTAADVGFFYETAMPLSIIKVWTGDTSADRPDAIEVNVIGENSTKQEKYKEKISLAKSSNYQMTLSDLPKSIDGEALTYSVTEVAIDGYTIEKIEKTEKSDEIIFTITNKKAIPTPTVKPDPTPTAEPDPTPTAEPDPTPTVKPDPTPTAEPDPTPTAEPDPTPTVSPITTSLTVHKEWENVENSAVDIDTDSAVVRVRLIKNGVDTDNIIELSKENNWTNTFTNIPTTENGENITYTMEEINPLKGIYVDYKGIDKDGVYQIINVAPMIAGKVFYDGNRDGEYNPVNDILIGKVNVTISSNDDNIILDPSVKTTALTDEDGDYYFYRLPLKADGSGSYNVTVTNPYNPDDINCTTEQTGNQTVFNNNISQTVNFNNGNSKAFATDTGFYGETPHSDSTKKIKMTKEWKDGSDVLKQRPNTITAYIYGKVNEVEVISYKAELSDGNNWSYLSSELPIKDDSNKDIVYSVDELDVSGYTKSISQTSSSDELSFTITNTINDPIPTVKPNKGSGGGSSNSTSVLVTKKWDDNDNANNTRPKSVKVTIMNGTEAVASYELNSSNNWKHTFTGLKKYNSSNKTIEYTVKEDTIENYVPTYTKTTTGYIITNTYSENPEVTPTPAPDVPSLNYDDHYAYIIGYPEGDVRPLGSITRAEVATIFFRMLSDESRTEYWTQDNNYSDVDIEKWYNNAVSTMNNANIVSGYEDGSFKPDAPITRAEFAAMSARFDNGVYTGDDKFSDISGHWAKEYINRAADRGWINGYEDGTFNPDKDITRAEAMTLVNNMLNRIVHNDGMLDEMIKWPDNTSDKWYYSAVQEATNSHYYDRIDDGYEKWSNMREVRDWEALEKEYSTSQSAGEQETVFDTNKD